MSKQSDELRDYFYENGITNRDVAEKIGLHEGSVSNILSGRFGISKNVATKLSEVFGFSIRFLMTGDGALMPPSGVHISQNGNTNNGKGAGAIHVGADDAVRAENAALRDQLARERAEKERLLGIIETMTGK